MNEYPFFANLCSTNLSDTAPVDFLSDFPIPQASPLRVTLNFHADKQNKI